MTRGEHEDRVFKALADPTRRRILDLLVVGERTTGDLCERLTPLDRCTTMLHLAVLERAGLVLVRREGRRRWNSLDAAPIQQVYDRWVSRYARPSLALLMRLKADLEGGTSRSPGRTSRTAARGGSAVGSGPSPEASRTVRAGGVTAQSG